MRRIVLGAICGLAALAVGASSSIAKADAPLSAGIKIAKNENAANPGKGKGKGNSGKANSGKANSGKANSGNAGQVLNDLEKSAPWILGQSDRETIREYYGSDQHGCPPGLAKKNNGCLPPGQAKKRYQVGQTIPGDVSIESLPDILRSRLPPAPDGYQYQVIDGDVALIQLGTNIILDAIF
jgi:hypothetical protein